MEKFSLTSGRNFSKLEQAMIWKKPTSHQTSTEELRIASEIKSNWTDPEMKIMNVLLEGDAGSGKTQLAKALSADLQLPYTKVTCFADMDKSDVLGALLPVIATDDEDDQELLDAIYQTESLEAVLQLIQSHYSVGPEAAKERLVSFIQRIEKRETEPIQYKYYPSEIVRAMEKGYLLEIQEPTVIRDASVLVALNSALEPNGMLNLPAGIVRRHPDCVVVITTNRNYQGNRPLNESLRDRMQHAEKMDLPSLEVMVERAVGKTAVQNKALLMKMAKIIRLLDETAKANAIKGVAGMRSYFYWVNTFKNGQDLLQSIYPKVLYKLTTDPDELTLLTQALDDSGLLVQLRELLVNEKANRRAQKAQARRISSDEAAQRGIEDESEHSNLIASESEQKAEEETIEEAQEKQEKTAESDTIDTLETERSSDVEGQSKQELAQEEPADEESQEMSVSDMEAYDQKIKRELNKEARQALKETIHQKEGLIVHRPKIVLNDPELKEIKAKVMPVVDTLSRQILDLLENERSSEYSKGKYEGQRFDASRVAYGDLRTFDKKNPPHEQPSLALAVRIDESGSMIREGRIDAAKQAVLAIKAFAERVSIPLMIYGDTADASAREKTSLYSYKEFQDSFDFVDEKLITMKPRQNNRDGAALKVIAEKLSQQTATAKLLLNISDGQPKALPDYTGEKAKQDIQEVLQQYERQGVLVLAAAIGQDKEEIKEIYGDSRFIDITDLNEFPRQMIQLIARYL
ncbi:MULTISPECIES: AAA family ATPase [unclassified Enterococcus]|jgi:MoxR-like ATPase|uniref:AAA family ATPase n=1 Tax=unclassified Enterococcus TaxID=2608891 RepID=UPI003D28A16C